MSYTRTVLESRASSILYNLLRSRTQGPDIYLLPANVCLSVPLTVVAAGARPAFVDIDSESLGMSVETVCQRLETLDSSRVAGIIYVRGYGVESDASSFFEALRRMNPDLLLIDDRCLSRPALDRESLATEGAQVALFSTGRGKYVDLGHGGFAHLEADTPYTRHHRAFHDEDLEHLERVYDRKDRYGVPEAEMHDEAARLAWLDTGLPTLDWATFKERVHRSARLRDRTKEVQNAIYRRIVPRTMQFSDRCHPWRFQIQVRNKIDVLDRIFAAGLFASSHFYPIGTQFEQREFPAAERLHENVINLFNAGEMEESEVRTVAEIVREHGEPLEKD